MLIFVEKYGILNAHQILRRSSMRAVITFFGVIAVGGVLAMIFFAPDAKESFRKEHCKSLILGIIPMIAFLVLAYYVLSHVGL